VTTPINLNKARKARAKTKRKARADENVVLHGRSKAEKDAVQAREESKIAHIDAHKRET